MQGFTLPVGKVDLNLRHYADPVTGYVAMSRFRRADDVLILQPFDLAVFQQGIADQPRLLLERLRDPEKDMSAVFESWEQAPAGTTVGEGGEEAQADGGQQGHHEAQQAGPSSASAAVLPRLRYGERQDAARGLTVETERPGEVQGPRG